MSAPRGLREWLGVFLALAVLCVGLVILGDVRDGEELAPALVNVAIGLGIALLATAVWWAWAYLRGFDWPGHQGEPPDELPPPPPAPTAQ